jgi:hypothetical protein
VIRGSTPDQVNLDYLFGELGGSDQVTNLRDKKAALPARLRHGGVRDGPARASFGSTKHSRSGRFGSNFSVRGQGREGPESALKRKPGLRHPASGDAPLAAIPPSGAND